MLNIEFTDAPQLGPIVYKNKKNIQTCRFIREGRRITPVKNCHPSGPRTPDPYSIDDSSITFDFVY